MPLLLLYLATQMVQPCHAVAGMSRVLKQLYACTPGDSSMVGVINQMVVTELLDNKQSLDVILDCLKVYLVWHNRRAYFCLYI